MRKLVFNVNLSNLRTITFFKDDENIYNVIFTFTNKEALKNYLNGFFYGFLLLCENDVDKKEELKSIKNLIINDLEKDIFNTYTLIDYGLDLKVYKVNGDYEFCIKTINKEFVYNFLDGSFKILSYVIDITEFKKALHTYEQ
ncbi:MAG: hypothetical protein QXX03_08360 [Nitrososphaerota archaeon]